jgi:hypothetical protein
VSVRVRVQHFLSRRPTDPLVVADLGWFETIGDFVCERVPQTFEGVRINDRDYVVVGVLHELEDGATTTTVRVRPRRWLFRSAHRWTPR